VLAFSVAHIQFEQLVKIASIREGLIVTLFEAGRIMYHI
jgi:hypothetical protein